MASVRIENEAFSDRRYDRLAKLAGLADADHARGKMAVVWRQCTIEQRHTLDEDTIRDILGDDGPEALVSSRLGERTPEGIRIKGTSGRIEWLKRLRSNGKHGRKGGRPKNPQGLCQENPQGLSVQNPQGLCVANPKGGQDGYVDQTPLALTLTPSLSQDSLPTSLSPSPVSASTERSDEREKKSRKFTKPSVADVAEYCRERSNRVDPQAFCDHYEAKGWVVGTSPMRDWKAAVRTWESRQREEVKQTPQAPVYRQGGTTKFEF